MNRSLLALHRWLGLPAGMFLLFIGLSGSLLVYSNSLERWLNPTLYTIEPQGNRLSLDSVYNIVYRKYSADFKSCSMDVPASAREVYEFTFTKPRENYYTRNLYIVDVHPYTGEILREGFCDDISTSFIHWLMYFHNSFHLGKIGMLIVTLVSMTIFLSMITGLLIYGKNIFNVLMFRIPLKWKSGQHLYRSIHLYIGVWSLLMNIVIFFTGFWMMKATLNPNTWKLEVQQQTFRTPVSLDSCLVKCTEILPGFIPDFVSIPLIKNDPIEIDGNMANSSQLMRGDASYVILDAQNGNVIEAVDITKTKFPKNLTAAFWQLHIGNYGGDIIKILYVIGGLMPGVLFLSGFVLWWKRSVDT